MKSARVDDADHPVGPVRHRQRLDAALVHQAPGVLQGHAELAQTGSRDMMSAQRTVAQPRACQDSISVWRISASRSSRLTSSTWL